MMRDTDKWGTRVPCMSHSKWATRRQCNDARMVCTCVCARQLGLVHLLYAGVVMIAHQRTPYRHCSVKVGEDYAIQARFNVHVTSIIHWRMWQWG